MGKFDRRAFLRTAALAVAGAPAAACAPAAQVAEQTIDLPAPAVAAAGSLEAALAGRRSVRRFTAQDLTPQELGQLFWALQGVTRDWGGRTAPSAGALYPLEAYAATAEGLVHYLPQEQRTVLTPRLGLRQELWQAALKQDWIREAPAVFVLAAVYERTAGKYGDRAQRYVHLEAGHAAQNLLLQAVALGLGGVPVGAFYDERVKKALDLPADQEPLYLITVGHPDE